MLDPEKCLIALTRKDIDPPYEIKRLHHDQAHRRFGVRLAPNGKWSEELRFLKGKISRFTLKLKMNYLTTYEARLALKTMFNTSIYYSFGVTSFTEVECEELQKPSRPAWLQVLGYNSQYLQAVAFAPWWIGGIEMLQPFIVQGLKGLTLFMGHVRLQTQVGKLITVGLEFFRLIVGTSSCPLLDPMAKVAYEMQD